MGLPAVASRRPCCCCIPLVCCIPLATPASASPLLYFLSLQPLLLCSSPKGQKVLGLVTGLLKRGVPIHGVGLQMHVSVNYYPDPAEVQKNMEALGALGILTHITEMDVQCSKCTAARLATQAQIYGAMLTACLSVPSCRSFETWGFTDKYSWLGSAVAPLPFDANFGGKPAFDQLLAVLQKHASGGKKL